METDHDLQAAQENNPDQQQGSSDEQEASPAAARSYECTFCKRGFSNAQALGGHMNIHRRDKAKLKQAANSPSTETNTATHHHQQQQQSSDIIPKIMIPSYSSNHPTSTTQPIMEFSRSSGIQEIRSNPGKWPATWVTQDADADADADDDAHQRDKTSSCHNIGSDQMIRQLPLFDEKPTTITTDKNPNSQVEAAGRGIEKGLSSSSQGSSGSDQLDLELRLGPEPQDSSPTITTKKFF